MIASDDIFKKDLFDQLEIESKERLESNPNLFSEQDFRRFIRAFYQTMTSDELSKYTRCDLFQIAYSLYSFALNRTDDIKIRIFNPTKEKNGWSVRCTVIEIIMPDTPFQIDSILIELNQRKLNTFTLTYPLIPIKRIDGKASQLYAPDENASGVVLESVMQFTINYLQESTHEELKNSIHALLQKVICVTEDWPFMRQKLDAINVQLAKKAPTTTDQSFLRESQNFLKWIYEDHFTFLGYRYTDYVKKGVKYQLIDDFDSALGLLKDITFHPFGELTDIQTQSVISSMQQTSWLIRVIKSSHYSRIHRFAPMDTFAIKEFDSDGQLIGEHLFIGLFTIAAYNQSVFAIPLLRRHGQLILEQSNESKKSHYYKALYKVLETFPRDEIFQTRIEILEEILAGMAHIIDRGIPDIFVIPDTFLRGVSALVLIPYHHYSSRLELQIGQSLATYFSGEVTFIHAYTGINDAPLILIQYYITLDQGIPSYDIHALKLLIKRFSQPWEDTFKNILCEKLGREKGYLLHSQYHFELPYQMAITPEDAIDDVIRFETCENNINVALSDKPEEDLYELRLYYRHAANISPSKTVPLLENLGFQVLHETPFNLTIKNAPACLYNFLLKPIHKANIDVNLIQESFRQLFLQVWVGQAENDSYNRLALAGMNLHEITIIRAYARYLGQLDVVPFSQGYISSLITDHIEVASKIASYFKMRFSLPKRNEQDLLKEEEAIKESLNKIQNNDADRILRSLFQICQATLRTNFFQPNKPYLSLKIDSHLVKEIPKPIPYREIFVYSPDFEAIHLRFSPISRGGIRWSDRPQDFRTEILGLVKTQQVKNAVIVPMGAKGGFILKKAPKDRDALLQEAIRCYQLFIQALLDITDNIVCGNIINPDNVIRYDQDDPYLVVAADKGTATFSDYANEISKKHNFWLGDAFASGGSAGYDHKKMGITARGAMICVERHFYELGHNIYKDDFSVVGIGDMSGDVFGNGMLLSQHICLIAAFNHIHIFIDPKPDPIKSFDERKRLFHLPGSNWSDYSKKLISKGGGVFDRKAKTIPVSPEMRERFQITVNEITPNELIKCILCAEYDLLWLGGIGTYIKHSMESHADVKDNANNAVRVNAKDLKCRVLGEGANLGVTQRARIEFSEKGGLCYTDAIDNSAGVTCSDHEVNIKILLNPLMQSSALTEENRNKLLESITDDVASLVLKDNQKQAQILAFLYAYQDLDKYQTLIQYMESHQFLDRALEALPSDDELADRARKGIGLMLPELAILLAYSKNMLYKSILETNIPELPIVQHMLFDYFPKKLVEQYNKEITQHPLKREIITTVLVNFMLNHTDPAFIINIACETSHSLYDIICSYLIVIDVFSLPELFTAIENLQETITAKTQVSLFYEIGKTIKRITHWFLNNEDISQPLEKLVEQYKLGVQTLNHSYETFLNEDAIRALKDRLNRFLLPGVPENLAETINLLKLLSMSCDLIRLATIRHADIIHVARIYSAVGTKFRFDSLRTEIGKLPLTTTWEKACAYNLIEELWSMQFRLCNQILQHGNESDLNLWIEQNKQHVEHVEKLFSKASHITYNLTMLTVLTQNLCRFLIKPIHTRQ